MMDTEKQMEVIAGLEYIANSPSRERGGFHRKAVDTAEDALSLIEEQRRRIAELEAGQPPAKPFDFDALFADTRQTVEYWQARCELLEGEIAAVRDANDAGDEVVLEMQARIVELEEQNRILRLAQKACADCEDVQRLAMCEQELVLLTPGRLYVFSPIDECAECQRLMDQLSTTAAVLPVGPLPEPPEVTT